MIEKAVKYILDKIQEKGNNLKENTQRQRRIDRLTTCGTKWLVAIFTVLLMPYCI